MYQSGELGRAQLFYVEITVIYCQIRMFKESSIFDLYHTAWNASAD